MQINIDQYNVIKKELDVKQVTLVAVSKIQSIEKIKALYDLGERNFGENYVQELCTKYEALKHLNINWHFIGHLQSNKVKYIAPFIHLIQSVDSVKLLKEINKEGKKNNRIINCLLQIYIAKEETKYGLDEKEFEQIIDLQKQGILENVCIKGLMGMASFVDDEKIVISEFKYLQSIFNQNSQFEILSMGMSGDYKLAIEHGSNMVRIGSLIFGARK
jgi:PLP dependent protein